MPGTRRRRRRVTERKDDGDLDEVTKIPYVVYLTIEIMHSYLDAP